MFVVKTQSSGPVSSSSSLSLSNGNLTKPPPLPPNKPNAGGRSVNGNQIENLLSQTKIITPRPPPPPPLRTVTSELPKRVAVPNKPPPPPPPQRNVVQQSVVKLAPPPRASKVPPPPPLPTSNTITLTVSKTSPQSSVRLTKVPPPPPPITSKSLIPYPSSQSSDARINKLLPPPPPRPMLSPQLESQTREISPSKPKRPPGPPPGPPPPPPRPMLSPQLESQTREISPSKPKRPPGPPPPGPPPAPPPLLTRQGSTNGTLPDLKSGIPSTYIKDSNVANSFAERSCSGRRAAEYIGQAPIKSIDAIAMAVIPPNAKVSTSMLASYLRSAVQSLPEMQRVSKSELNFALLRVIFRWVAHNIEYDVDSFFGGRMNASGSSPETVLKTGKAVCEGYATLMAQLGSCIGLKILKASGWAKGYGYTVGDIVNTSVSPNHAWNLVELDGDLYHLDATWSAGFVNGRQYTRRWNDHYFLTPSEVFIFDHFPENEYHQLLKPPVSLKQYSGFPVVKSHYFQAGVQCISHAVAVIECEGGEEFDMEFSMNVSWTFMIPQIFKNGREEKRTDGLAIVLRKNNGNRLVRVRAPQGIGDFVLRLMVMPLDENHGDWAVDYLIKTTSAGKAPIPFPKNVPPLCELLEPLTFFLPVGKTVHFRHKLIGTKGGVHVILPGNDWRPLNKSVSKDGSIIYEGDVFIKSPGEIKVFATEKSGGSTRSLYAVGIYQAQ